MLFKDNSTLSSAGCFVEQSRTICAFVGRGHYKEHVCKIILNLDQWLRRGCHLNIFLFLELVASMFNEAKWFLHIW